MNPSRCPCSLPVSRVVLRRLALLALALVCGVSWVTAQQPAAPAKTETPAAAKEIDVKPSSPEALALDKQIIEQAKKNPEVIPNLTYLCDVIGPRLTGSANLKRANEWTMEKMKSYGLSNVQMEPWTIPVAWERGSATAKLLEPENGRTLTVAASGWSPSTKGKIEGDVVFVKATSTKELEPYKGKLKNAIVLRSAPTPVRPITDNKMQIPGAFGGGGRRRGDAKDGEAKKPGEATKDSAKSGDVKTEKKAADAKADPKAPADGKSAEIADRLNRFGGRGNFQFMSEMSAFLRAEGAAVVLQDAGKPHGLLNMGGGWRNQERADAAEPLPSLFVTHEDYGLLYRLATRPAPAKTRAQIEVQNKLIPGPIVVYNTVGDIPGKEKPNEYVILGAHLDSWDLGTGATDNGTGSMVVLETARILSQLKVQPRRTIRFVLFTGEEQGLHGSKAYVAKHKEELPRISMCLVHDTGTGKVLGIGLQGRKPLVPLMKSELVSLNELGAGDINESGMGGTDHLSFEQAGVPGFACRQEFDEYRFTHHSQSDTLDKAKEANLVQAAQVMAVAAMRVANLDLLLPRDK